MIPLSLGLKALQKSRTIWSILLSLSLSLSLCVSLGRKALVVSHECFAQACRVHHAQKAWWAAMVRTEELLLVPVGAYCVRFLKVLRWFWALWVGAVRTSISMGEWSPSLSLYPLSALILDKQRILQYYCQSSTTLLVLFFFFFRLLARVVTTEWLVQILYKLSSKPKRETETERNRKHPRKQAPTKAKPSSKPSFFQQQNPVSVK